MGTTVARLDSGNLTSVVPSKRTLSVLQSVAEWDPAGERDPPGLDAEAMVEIERSLTPAPRHLAAEELASVLSFFDPPTGNVRAHTEACLNMLADVPLDIVRSAMMRVTAECTFTPKPAEIRKRVDAELGERKRLVIKARVAARMAECRRRERDTRETPTDEERARVSEAVSRLAQTRETIAKSRVEERPARPEREALAIVAKETMAFRLPDPDDPRVVEIMARMDGAA